MILKGQSNKIFDPHFHSKLPFPLTNGLKYFFILVRISRLRIFLVIILRIVNLPAVGTVSYWGDSCDFSGSYLIKETFQQDFSTSSFFHHSNLSGPLATAWAGPGVNQIFHKNLPAVSDCAVSISPQFHTSGCHSWPQPFLKTFTEPFKGTVSQKINVDSFSTKKGLHWFCGESVFSILTERSNNLAKS